MDYGLQPVQGSMDYAKKRPIAIGLLTGAFWQHQNIEIWKADPHCIICCLWQERNTRSFEGCERSILDLKLLFFKS